jgi:hypothetical protein
MTTLSALPSPVRVAGLRVLALFAGLLLAGGARAATTAPEEFSRLVKLEPFVVQGKQLTISIHARSSRDRRYAQDFAEEVIKVVYEAVTPETGKGLVIIGAKGEPHPILFFRKFQALAEAGKLDPAIAARAPELTALINHWRGSVDEERKSGGKEDMEFERIVTALPLQLDGIGAKLYQLAWAEQFDDTRLEARLRTLKPVDLEQRSLFANFDWVFYLPPKHAFDQVLDDLVSDAMKEEKAGFFARVLVKGVLLAVRPKIRHAVEGLRQGLLFQAIVSTRTPLPAEEVSSLTSAYVEAVVGDDDDDGKKYVGNEHERAVHAIRAELKKYTDKPSSPPEPTEK